MPGAFTSIKPLLYTWSTFYVMDSLDFPEYLTVFQ